MHYDSSYHDDDDDDDDDANHENPSFGYQLNVLSRSTNHLAVFMSIEIIIVDLARSGRLLPPLSSTNEY